MAELDIHTMEKVHEHEGTEEWMCPECDRIVLITWHPKFIKTEIETGNTEVAHTGFLADAGSMI